MYYNSNPGVPMRTISVRLDEETSAKLAEIMVRMGVTNQSELIKRLINERWIALAPGKTFLERRGGHPKYLLEEGRANRSDRQARKQLVAEHYEERRRRRKST